MDSLRLFGTDVVFGYLPGADAYLSEAREVLLAERGRSPGLQASQVGGWHSIPDLAQRSAPFRPIMEAIVSRVGQVVADRAQERRLAVPPFQWSVQSWAIILDTGGYNRVHDHAESHWSVAFYVDGGDPATELGGALTLLDPRRATPAIPGLDLYPSTLDLRPQTGHIAIFPGYLQHMVHPYDGTRPRIVISANLMMRVQHLPPG